MNCPDLICRLVSCDNQGLIPEYLGRYSLQTGQLYVNLLMSVPVDYGNGYYYVQPNAIRIPLAQGSQFVSFQGCESTITLEIPVGADADEIKAIVAEVMVQAAEQFSRCNAPPIQHKKLTSLFSNAPVSLTCPGGLLLNINGTIPPTVSWTVNSLVVKAGIFTSIKSQADADAQAMAYGQLYFNAEFQCGYWNTLQTVTCSDLSTRTTPAYLYFSIVSQADADAQALAAATASCPTLSNPPYFSFPGCNFAPAGAVITGTDAAHNITCNTGVTTQTGCFVGGVLVNYFTPGFGTGKVVTLGAYNCPGWTATIASPIPNGYFLKLSPAVPNPTTITGWFFNITVT